MVETLAGLEAGTIVPRVQNHAAAVLAPLLTREDARIDFAACTAQEIFNRWRGFQPWPGAWTTLEGKKLILHRLAIAEFGACANAGEVRVFEERIYVACRENTWIELKELQLEGKRRMSAEEFLHGNALDDSAKLGR